VDGTVSGLCSMASFGVSCVGPSCSATKELANKNGVRLRIGLNLLFCEHNN
jgi:hypothetical protein